jgi:very-short-patch-repair endonuclease
MHVAQALDRLGGVAGFRELEQLVSRHEITKACRDGQILRLRRNVYTTPALDEARAAAAQVNGVVSHLSAAIAHGWKVKVPPRQPMVTVRRNAHPKDTTGIELTYADWTADDVVNGTTGRVRTVIDCARALPFDQALAVADSALRSGKVTREQLEKAAQASPRTGRSRVLRVVREASPRAANPFESVLRAIALDVPGLVVVPQGEVGLVGHADLIDERLRIAIEADSYEFHSLPEAFRYDVRRYTDMVRLGWVVVRFVWEDVMQKPEYVRGVLADVVAWRSLPAAA